MILNLWVRGCSEEIESIVLKSRRKNTYLLGKAIVQKNLEFESRKAQKLKVYAKLNYQWKMKKIKHVLIKARRLKILGRTYQRK